MLANTASGVEQEGGVTGQLTCQFEEFFNPQIQSYLVTICSCTYRKSVNLARQICSKFCYKQFGRLLP